MRNILAGAAPFDLDVAGTTVSCSMSAAAPPPWPKLDRLDEHEDGPWPSDVNVDCRWGQGSCRILVGPAWWTHGKYRHDITLRARLADRPRELVWINVANEIDDVADGARARLVIRFFTSKRKTKVPTEISQRVNRAMRDVLRESGLPVVSESTAMLCEIDVPGGEIHEGGATAFRRLIHIALMKLDFVDRRRARERGAPLIDLKSRFGITEPEVADVDDEDESESSSQVTQYWAGGFDEQTRLERFISENMWQVGWKRDDARPAAVRTWKAFDAIQVGDHFAIKGLGGTHDLVIHYVGEVMSIEAEAGRLQLRRSDVPLYRGKAPTKTGAGNWHDTLVPVTRPDIIAMVFGGAVPAADAIVEQAPVDLPLNLILYGPPGTGKRTS